MRKHTLGNWSLICERLNLVSTHNLPTNHHGAGDVVLAIDLAGQGLTNDGFYGIIGMEGTPNVKEAEMRELDAWIAKQDGLKGIVYATGATFKFSLDPNDFSLVKDAITERGWGWECLYLPDISNGYSFRILAPDFDSDCVGRAETEELAGCLAFKEAVEATNGGQHKKSVNLICCSCETPFSFEFTRGIFSDSDEINMGCSHCGANWSAKSCKFPDEIRTDQAFGGLEFHNVRLGRVPG